MVGNILQLLSFPFFLLIFFLFSFALSGVRTLAIVITEANVTGWERVESEQRRVG